MSDSRGTAHRAIRIQEQSVKGAAAGRVLDIAIGPDHQVRHPVSVEVAERRDRRSKLVTITERRAAARSAADFRRAARRAVRIEGQQINGAAIRSSRVILKRTDSEIGDPVAIDVARRRDGNPEGIVRIEARPAVRVARNSAGRFDGSVAVEKEDVDRARTVAARPGRQVDDTVSVQIAQRRQ